jgi:putative oxidoreductase
MASTSRLLRAIESGAPESTILIRIAVGVVFTSEGIQKFLYPDALGAGRFAKIGIPAPEVMGPFVGVVETLCGLLILAGLLTRLAALPLVIDMLVAIASTKVPILLGHGYFLFANPSVAKTGLWSMLHEARTDLSMLLGSIFLLLAGAGGRSLDGVLARRLTGRVVDDFAALAARHSARSR